jgi:hypothetical protein
MWAGPKREAQFGWPGLLFRARLLKCSLPILSIIYADTCIIFVQLFHIIINNNTGIFFFFKKEEYFILY